MYVESKKVNPNYNDETCIYYKSEIINMKEVTLWYNTLLGWYILRFI